MGLRQKNRKCWQGVVKWQVVTGFPIPTYCQCEFPPVGVSLLEDGEELEDGELAPVVIDTQMLPLSLHRGQSAHGNPNDGVPL